MGKTRDQLTEQQVRDIVQPFTDAHRPDDDAPVVEAVEFSSTIGWIVAVDDVDREDVNGLDWATRLVNIEQVQDKSGHDIHVHPVMYRED
jgi:hypothetical protein